MSILLMVVHKQCHNVIWILPARAKVCSASLQLITATWYFYGPLPYDSLSYVWCIHLIPLAFSGYRKQDMVVSLSLSLIVTLPNRPWRMHTCILVKIPWYYTSGWSIVSLARSQYLVSVCVSVCFRYSKSCTTAYETENEQYQCPQYYFSMNFKMKIFVKPCTAFKSYGVKHLQKRQYANKFELTTSCFRTLSRSMKHGNYLKDNWWFKPCLRGYIGTEAEGQQVARNVAYTPVEDHFPVHPLRQ